uniref:Mitochondrial fission process protein 1 n=1 Tax=Clastoptera arizonana TaxID=38151 RepID=A0A1B6DPK4_9HEMI
MKKCEIYESFKNIIFFQKKSVSEEKRRTNSLITAFDALLWQGLASVVIPGFTINRICWATHHFLLNVNKIFKVSKQANKIITVATGLASIPLIIKPIDHAVDYCLDNTIRPLVKTYDR